MSGVGFDFVAQDEIGARVAGLGLAELVGSASLAGIPAVPARAPAASWTSRRGQRQAPKSARSSAPAGTRCSRRSRTTARANPHLLSFTAHDQSSSRPR